MRINKQVIAWLRKVSNGYVTALPDIKHGLCCNLDIFVKCKGRYGQVLDQWLIDNYGNVSYPVEHPSLSNRDAYNMTRNLWMNIEGTKDTQVYIQSRLKLVNDFADYLEGIECSMWLG